MRVSLDDGAVGNTRAFANSCYIISLCSFSSLPSIDMSMVLRLQCERTFHIRSPSETLGHDFVVLPTGEQDLDGEPSARKLCASFNNPDYHSRPCSPSTT